MQGGKETFTPKLCVCLGLAKQQAAGQALLGAEHGDWDRVPAGHSAGDTLHLGMWSLRAAAVPVMSAQHLLLADVHPPLLEQLFLWVKSKERKSEILAVKVECPP